MIRHIGLDLGAAQSKWWLDDDDHGVQATAMATRKPRGGREKETDMIFGDAAASSEQDYHIQNVLQVITKGVPEKGGVSAEVQVDEANLRSFLRFLKGEAGLDETDFNVRAVMTLPHCCFRWVKAEGGKAGYYQPNELANSVRRIAEEVFGHAAVYSEVVAALAALARDHKIEKGIVVDIGSATLQLAYCLQSLPEQQEIVTHFGAVRGVIERVRDGLAALLGDEEAVTLNEAAELFRSKASCQNGTTITHDFCTAGISDVREIQGVVVPVCRALAGVIASRLDAVAKALSRPTINAYAREGVFQAIYLTGGGSQIAGIEEAVLEAVGALKDPSVLKQGLEDVVPLSAKNATYLVVRGALLLQGRKPGGEAVPPATPATTTGDKPADEATPLATPDKPAPKAGDGGGTGTAGRKASKKKS